MAKSELPKGKVKARVLRSGGFGKCDDVVVVDQAVADSSGGELDAHPSAVAYAESLASPASTENAE